jgi:FKBP-type peptidyl-prolyl cis-trans isomerase SlyD
MSKIFLLLEENMLTMSVATAGITRSSKILLNYSLSSEDELFDTTEAVGPLEVTLGQGKLHPGIESLLEGRLEGESFECDLDPSLAFGEPKEELRFSIARSKLPVHLKELSLGSLFEGLGPDRKKHLFRVIEATDKRLSFDGNHPLAGKTLHLEAKILKVF